MINEIKPGLFVRITTAGIVSVGPVHSCYYADVYEDEEELITTIGEEVAGIEMYDVLRGREDRVTYRFWKALDRGPHKVEVWIHDHPGKWIQVYPRSFGGITYEERRQAEKDQ